MKRCQVASYATGPLTAVAPACGRRAVVWSDDVAESKTVWMCRECADEIVRSSDDGAVELHEVES